jgi:purine-binding chemotaxis protein CheW
LGVNVAERRKANLADRSVSWLLCRLGTHICALPLAHVTEIMRPLPIEPIGGAQHFVLGLAIVRGTPMPVVSTALLVGERGNETQRWVTLQVGGRDVVLAVDSVLGVSVIDATLGNELPPLLRDAASEVVLAIGTLDAELLLFLNAARIVPMAMQEGIVPEVPET